MGTHGIPDIYPLCPRAYSPQPLDIHIRQIPPAHTVKTVMYISRKFFCEILVKNFHIFSLTVMHFLHCIYIALETCPIKVMLHNLHYYLQWSVLFTINSINVAPSSSQWTLPLSLCTCVYAFFTTTTACLWPACTIVITKNTAQFT